MNENTHDKQFCTACGIEWHEHDGMIRTCTELQRLRSVIQSIRSLLGIVADADQTRERKEK